ncbi:MAG: AAA family ATPase [Trueperaceae bacterium]|nr:AAA family ATPase [Trueperaceae bacterium]
MTTTLKLLGTPKLLLADAALSLERKTAAVLAYLALEGATQKYKLAGMLWPQSGEHAARNNMRQLLRRLRLQAELITGDDLIELRPELEVDVRHLSSLVSPSLALLKEGGDLLEGLDYDDAPDLAAWLEICREDLLRQRVYLAKAEAQRLEQGGNFRQALDYAQVWLKLEPLTEEAYVQLARLQYFLGDKQGALICLRRCLNLLTDELGAEPQDATLALLHMIERGESPSKKVTTAPTIPASILRPPMLVGREAHWAEMERAWTEGKLIFLSGEAGSGKSRLAADFLASKGAFITEQARPGDIHVPYASHTRFLRGYLQRYPSYSLPGWVQQALSPWLPELETSTTPQANQLRFADASLELMRQIGQHGEALLIDDVQFMDEASLQLSSYTFSQLQPFGLEHSLKGLVGCFRRDELSAYFEEQVATLLASGMAVRIELEPLSGDSLQDLLGSLNLAVSSSLVESLGRYTGGNPLFVLETLKYLIESSQLEQGFPSRLSPQGKVATLIGRRLQRLSPTALNLARVAAIDQPEFNLELASVVLERSGFDLAEAHAELENSQIMRAQTFSHDLVFEAVLAAMPLAVKQLLHGRIAQYLEAVSHSSPAKIAQHYLDAGRDLSAANFLVKAAEQALNGSLLAEARKFAEKAVTIYHEAKDPQEYAAVTQLFEILGIHGSFDELKSCSEKLVMLAKTARDKVKALARWSEYLDMTRRFAEALEVVTEALLLVDDDLDEAQLRQTEFYCHLRLGHYDLAGKALQRYKELANGLDVLELTGSVLEDEGAYFATLDQHPKALDLFGRVISLIDQHEQYDFARSRLHSRMAHSRLYLGHFDEALADIAQTKKTLETYEIIRRGYVWPLSVEAQVYLARGELAQAWEKIKLAETYDREEHPKVTYLPLARILSAVGQKEAAVAELEAFFAQGDSEINFQLLASIELATLCDKEEILDKLQQQVSQLNKPEVSIRYLLAKAGFIDGDKRLELVNQALTRATTLNLNLLAARAYHLRADYFIDSNQPGMAHKDIETALSFPGSLSSPAALYFSAHQIFKAMGDSRESSYLQQAQDWIFDTADSLDKELRRPFLNQPLHKKIL